MHIPPWEPGTQYNYNDEVSYEGSFYKIIQPHRSQGDWTPPVTPALWGKVQGWQNECDYKKGDRIHHDGRHFEVCEDHNSRDYEHPDRAPHLVREVIRIERG